MKLLKKLTRIPYNDGIRVIDIIVLSALPLLSISTVFFSKGWAPLTKTTVVCGFIGVYAVYVCYLIFGRKVQLNRLLVPFLWAFFVYVTLLYDLLIASIW